MLKTITLPIVKIDTANRIAWGVAQTPRFDKQGDEVTWDATVDAFTRWQKDVFGGNIREMHGNKAVGRAVKIIADPVEQKMYVGSYISPGAEDTWQKLLDGVLRAYSIGGNEDAATKLWDPDLKREKNLITRYTLSELSLVDNPANPDCVIFAVQKRGDRLVATGGLTQQEKIKVKKRVKIKTLAKFNTEVLKTPEDEAVVVKASDIAKLGAAEIADLVKDGARVLVLNKDAVVARIRKDEFDNDGYDGVQDDDARGPEPVDAGKHAKDAHEAHKAWHTVAGDEACNCESEPEGAVGEKDVRATDTNGDGVVDKTAKAAVKKSAPPDEADALRAKLKASEERNAALENENSRLAKSLDKIDGRLAALETAPATRLVKSGEAKLAERDSEGPPLQKAMSEFSTKSAERDQIIRKREAGQRLTTEEEIRAQELPQELMALDEHIKLLR